MAKKIVKVQDTKQINARTNYSQWVETQAPRNAEGEAMEPPEANSDILPESANPWFVTELQKEVRGRVHKLLDLAKQMLTEKQYEVFVLLAIRCKTQRFAAAKLSISQPAVTKIWESARIKLQKAYEERT